VRRRRPAATKSKRHRAPDTAFLGVERALDWDDAESFAEEYIASATGAEAIAETARDEFVMEEVGGPFLDLPADDEDAAVRSVRWFGEDET
jgi:hypothetical protein